MREDERDRGRPRRDRSDSYDRRRRRREESPGRGSRRRERERERSHEADRRRSRRDDPGPRDRRREEPAGRGRWRHNEVYDAAYYYLSEAEEVEGDAPAPLDALIAPPPLKLLRSARARRRATAAALEEELEDIDSACSACYVLWKLDKAVHQDAAAAAKLDAEARGVLFASALRKCCMYFSLDTAPEVLRFVTKHYEAAASARAASPPAGAPAPMDQVAVKYIEKVITALPTPHGAAHAAMVQGVRGVVEGKDHGSLTVKEFLSATAAAERTALED
eukprot:TRINITY_DN25835_c0_g1_i1.p1 TRINITY_DN25835_c0_g1~~TRINITY_DN25835_c0_g1_i1.p1  ORF type:complete len:277 (+),score=85.83 TRINITY_DN25835_c0_g1_i1:69-899(+)